jgi:hypothetical protein
MDPVNSDFTELCEQLTKVETFRVQDVREILRKLGRKDYERTGENFVRRMRETGFAVYDGHAVGWRVVKK